MSLTLWRIHLEVSNCHSGEKGKTKQQKNIAVCTAAVKSHRVFFVYSVWGLSLLSFVGGSGICEGWIVCTCYACGRTLNLLKPHHLRCLIALRDVLVEFGGVAKLVDGSLERYSICQSTLQTKSCYTNQALRLSLALKIYWTC